MQASSDITEEYQAKRSGNTMTGYLSKVDEISISETPALLCLQQP